MSGATGATQRQPNREEGQKGRGQGVVVMACATQTKPSQTEKKTENRLEKNTKKNKIIIIKKNKGKQIV